MPSCLARIAILAAFACTATCATTDRASKVRPLDDAVRELADLMSGWFDSREQAEADPENYRAVRLVMVPIWKGRRDGRWLYVEQALAEELDEPYRQRVYRVYRDENRTLRSDVFTLPGDPLVFAGCWTGDKPLADLVPEQLTERDGCSVFFDRIALGVFAGATRGEGCASTLQGATYATSEVWIEGKRLVSWDRGWNAAQEQVWGATRGGYTFVKQDHRPPR